MSASNLLAAICCLVITAGVAVEVIVAAVTT